MDNKYEPCSICELYICGYECHNDKCPVAKMKAEIERLKWECDSALKFLEVKREEEQREHDAIIKKVEAIKRENPATLSRVKAEAIKEFAERIEEDLGDVFMVNHPCVSAIIGNLVKEMTEVHNAEKNSI